jgi:acetyltransferase
MKNLTDSEYQGDLYPVNIRKTEILGLKAYQRLDQLPKPVDLAVIVTPAQTVPDILEQCGNSGITGIIIISAGFKEIGEKGKALETKILEIKKKYNLRIIGPNCLGIIRPSIHLNATFTSLMPKPGSIAFISQSGAVGGAILDWAMNKNIGFSNFVSVGSMIDVDFGDLIDYFGADPVTKSILIYIEGMTDAKRFMSAAKHFARMKPIIVIKAGKFSESSKAVSSHTGALTGGDSVYDAALKRAGVVRVDEVADLFSSAEVLSMQPLPKGPNLAIITNAGGLGVMATDALITRQGKLATLSQKTIESLDNVLPHYWSRGNPIDVLGDAKAGRYEAVIKACLTDENVDGLLIINFAVGDPAEIAKAIIQISKENRSDKTILTSFMGSARAHRKEAEVNQILTKNSIPTFSTPEQAVKAYMYMYQYKRNLELLYETPAETPTDIVPPKSPIITLFKNAALENREILTEEEAKAILEHCGITTVKTLFAQTSEEASWMASQIGYPVALKILSPQITHKTDAGGVVLDIDNETDLRKAFNLVMSRAKKYNPNAKIIGVTVQPMIRKNGHEVIIGAKKDPVFGPAIMFGMGGTMVELFKDVAIGLPPLNRTLAKRIMKETKFYSLLKGYRNLPSANIELLEEILVRFSQMLVDFPQIKEVDINPLIIDEKEAFVLDARIMIDKESVFRRLSPYEHLTINPYPRKYEDLVKLRGRQRALLRPIKPEDEPLILEMFNSFKDHNRYNFVTKEGETLQQAVVQICNVDYDREFTIIAELDEKGRRRIAGFARLITTQDEKTGEVTFIIADQWQRTYLGEKLAEYMITICSDKNIQEIHSKLVPEDRESINFLKSIGFTIEYSEDETLRATLKMHKKLT